MECKGDGGCLVRRLDGVLAVRASRREHRGLGREHDFDQRGREHDVHQLDEREHDVQ